MILFTAYLTNLFQYIPTSLSAGSLEARNPRQSKSTANCPTVAFHNMAAELFLKNTLGQFMPLASSPRESSGGPHIVPWNEFKRSSCIVIFSDHSQILFTAYTYYSLHTSQLLINRNSLETKKLHSHHNSHLQSPKITSLKYSFPCLWIYPHIS